MPIYEYRCADCGAHFERRLSFEQRLETQGCSACESARTSLQLSTPGRVGAAAGMGRAASGPTCPSTGAACGCGPALRN